jgi:hypothetical protein
VLAVKILSGSVKRNMQETIVAVQVEALATLPSSRSGWGNATALAGWWKP